MKNRYTIKNIKTKENLFEANELIIPRIGECIEFKTSSSTTLSRVIDIKYDYNKDALTTEVRTNITIEVELLEER